MRELLDIQKEVQKERPHVTLITNQELIAIQVMWNRDLEFDFTVGDIYKRYTIKILVLIILSL